MNEEQEYLNELSDIINNGFDEPNDRTGVGIKFKIGSKFTFDISNGIIPIWTTRKVPFRNQVVELLWFLNGKTDVKWLKDRKVNIWNNWEKPDGTIGPGYGKQWRNFNGVDQFEKLVFCLKNNPSSRRHVVSLYNVSEMDECALPCCHGLTIQFIVKNNNLHCCYYQRSSDFCLGFCPWQYALLTNIISKLTNLLPATLTAFIGNNHVYYNQIECAEQQLLRIPKQFPTLFMNNKICSIQDVENSSEEDFVLNNYDPCPYIKFPIAI